MTATAADLAEILNKLRYDTTAMQAKITDALNVLASLNLPSADGEQHPCPHDGLTFPSQRRLAEHLANVHQEGE